MELKQNILDCMETNNILHDNMRELANKIAEKLSIDSKDVVLCLKELISDGDVYEYDKGRFASTTSLGMVKGKLIGHNRGFGFVSRGPKAEDVFIPAKFMNGALNNDIVLVEILRDDVEEGHSEEGKVVKIISRGTDQIVGNYQKCKNFGWVLPDDNKFNKDIFIPAGKSRNAKDGDTVVVTITSYGGQKKPEGFVNEIIGDKSAPGNDVLSLMRQYKIYEEFPKDVMDYALSIPQTVSDNAKKNRKDFTKLTTFTIDGEDSKDFDDAVSLTMEDGYYNLGVHIADVGHYVQKDGILDKEAYKRGTSVYFCDRVVPMLPKELSNGICSLNEGVDRLTLSCMMKIDKDGNVVSHEICSSFIRSKHRMTYTSVFKMLEGDEEENKKYADIADIIHNMGELSDLLLKKRQERG